MQVQLLGTSDAAVELADAVFSANYNESLIHQVLTAYQATARQGSKAQKTRAEVRGGGRKPWRQKGTGNARAGTIRSPIWRSGGVTFAAKPRSYAQKVNKKMYRAAMRSILSKLLADDRLRVVDSISVPTPKTALLVKQLREWQVSDVLFVVDTLQPELWLSARNLPGVHVIKADELNPLDLIAYDTIIVNRAAIQQIEEAYS